MSWLIPRDELTSDQIRAIELSATDHRVVLGAPGSGKTQVLLHRARFLIDENELSQDQIKIFVYTNVLKQYIKSALLDLRLSEEIVTTFDDWCVKLHEQELGRLPWSKTTKSPDFAEVRQRVKSLVAKRAPAFQAVLVDEGQDLSPDCFEILKAIGKHVTVCMDHKQQIYETGSSEAEVVSALGLRRSSMALLDAFRCCPYIVQVAAEFVPDPSEK